MNTRVAKRSEYTRPNIFRQMRKILLANTSAFFVRLVETIPHTHM